MTRRPRIAIAAFAAALLAGCSSPLTSAPYPAIDPEAIRAHVSQYLAAEQLGMDPGGRGEQQAVAYTKSVFTSMGLSVQTPQVPLTRIRPTHTIVALGGAGGDRTLQDGVDYVMWTRKHEAVTTASGDLIFVGYGISVPRQGWDDYKDVDVRGKILLMLVGDPHVGTRHRLGALGGDVFGRGRYKFDEAARRGARGVLLVHLDDQADEPWEEVEHASTEVIDVGAPGKPTPHMPFEGWISFAAATRIFKDSSLDLEQTLAKVEETNFEPVPLPVHAAVQVQSEISGLTTTNVVATLPPVASPAEYVLFSSQWNNLPAGHPTGADLTDLDPTNEPPPGISVLLETARALSQVRTPHRGFVFLVVTAEPQGMLGLDGYLDKPTYSEAVTRAAIHVVGFNVAGSDKRVAIVGVAYETLKGMVREQAANQFRTAEADFDPERMHFFRPAKVSYTLKEIPSIFLMSGGSVAYTPVPVPSMDMSVGVLDARLLFRVGMRAATADNWPGWEPSRTILDVVPGAPAAEDPRRARGIR